MQIILYLYGGLESFFRRVSASFASIFLCCLRFSSSTTPYSSPHSARACLSLLCTSHSLLVRICRLGRLAKRRCRMAGSAVSSIWVRPWLSSGFLFRLRTSDGVPPYAQAILPTLVAQQRYDITLQLQVPNVDTSYALGNFMATLTLSTPSNKTLISIRRPVSTSFCASHLF